MDAERPRGRAGEPGSSAEASKPAQKAAHTSKGHGTDRLEERARAVIQRLFPVLEELADDPAS